MGDHHDIERVLHDYAWACDNGDWAALPGVFTDDVELDYSTTGGPTGGRDEVVGWLEESLSQVEMIQHVVSNFQIDVDGDTAAGRAMFFTSVRLPGLDGVLLHRRLLRARAGTAGATAGASAGCARTTAGCSTSPRRREWRRILSARSAVGTFAAVPGAADRFSLDGRIALVTGASSGLGEATARALHDAGARVAVTARRTERIEALAADVDGIAVPCDLLDLDGVRALVPSVVDALGAPSVVVNAAGGFDDGHAAEDEPLEVIERTLRLNLVAPYLLAQAAFPHLVSAGGGSIVNVSSISGQVGIPGIPQASYAASKAGLSGLTVELAVQWARHRIRVNTVAPGFFRSEITAPLFDSERGQNWLRRNTPLPDDGTADDVVGAILWLASDAGRFVTGQTIRVDGGWTAR